MKLRTQSEEADTLAEGPLVEIVEVPETQTSSELQKVKPLEETALDLEDSSVLDLGIYRPSKFSTSKPLVLVYIRPFKENIDPLLKVGEERISYIFRGITPLNLKKRFEEALGKLRHDRCTELRKEIFQYKYNLAHKEAAYTSAEDLDKTLHN